MCQRKEAVQVNDSNSGAKMICQQRAKNGIVPNSGVKIICQWDKNMAKNGIVPNSGVKIIYLETI